MEDSVTDRRVIWPDGSTSLPPIDLASPEPEQVAEGLWRMELRQPFVLGHTTGFPDCTVLSDGRVFAPGSQPPVTVCTGCDPAVLVVPGGDFTWLIADHEPGCDRYAMLDGLRAS